MTKLIALVPKNTVAFDAPSTIVSAPTGSFVELLTFLFSGMAAENVAPARTIHKLLRLGINDGKQMQRELTNKDILELRGEFRLNPVFIFDECSMISNQMLGNIHSRLDTVNAGRFDPNVSFG